MRISMISTDSASQISGYMALHLAWRAKPRLSRLSSSESSGVAGEASKSSKSEKLQCGAGWGDG